MKKHYLKTIEDIKYCEENNLVIRDAKDKICSYAFEGNCWVYYLEGQPALYNASIRLSSKLYYEEESIQEATKEDIGTLCRFWGRDYKDAELGILKEVSYDDDEVRYLSKEDYWYYHCHSLTPSEVAELTGYKVEEAE